MEISDLVSAPFRHQFFFEDKRMFAPINVAHFTILIPFVRNDFKVLTIEGIEAISTFGVDSGLNSLVLGRWRGETSAGSLASAGDGDA